MSGVPLSPAELIREAAALLQRGEGMAARALFQQAVDAGEAGAWMGVAAASRSLGDLPGELAALDGVLAARPGDLRALLLKGDRLTEAGEPRAAVAFYTAALNGAPANPPPDLRATLARAQAAVRRHASDYEAWLRAQLEPRLDGAATARFAQSLDLLFGRKSIYRQQPRIYYFPELPQTQFYPRQACPWLDAPEAAAAAITDELHAFLDDEAAPFEAYVQAEANRPVDDRHWMLRDPDWTALHLWKDGAPVAGVADRCPAVTEALANVPLCRTPGRTPTVLFSLLKPGARIPPHTGYVNTRLICHLPLIVPPGCGFRVGNDTREWVEGRAWAFDDTIEHEAWNRGDGLRAILIFDVWRPELSAEERALVAAMFEAIDAYGGGAESWSV